MVADAMNGYGKKPSAEYVLNFAFYSFVGFILFQAGFAIIANSESMLADCEAMAVDAMTYLFNLCAERIKNKPLTEAELALPLEKRVLRREVQRLWLELVPPTISVTCLIAIVILTLTEAVQELSGKNGKGDDDVSVPIMLVFSGANLLLDFVNVACFAKSGASFGLQMVREEQEEIRASLRGLRGGEVDALIAASLPSNDMGDIPDGETTDYGSALTLSTRNSHNKTFVNLNMCSAWTHVCADTLRSISVLIAAAISTFLPSVSGALSDSLAAVAVSIIILVSLFPLIQGLILTAIQLSQLRKDYGALLR